MENYQTIKKTDTEYKFAQRIYDLVDPWDRDGYTVEDIARTIKDDPLAIIEDLLDRLEA